MGMALGLAGLAGLPSSAIAQSDRPELSAVRFQGNVAFPDEALRGAILNRQTECKLPRLFCFVGLDLKARSFLRPREVARDALRLQVYYLERGFREAQVDTAVARTGESATLTFEIVEGRPVTVDSVDVFSFDDIPDPGLFDDLPLQAGDPLSALLLEETRDTLRSRLLNNGFAFADVLVNYEVPRDSYSAQVLFDVATGPRTRFGPITVLGTIELDSTSVRQLLPFRQGQLYRAVQIVEGQRNLYGLELIQSAQVRPILIEGDTLVPVQVNVSEGQVHRVRQGFGWSTADCITAEARWASRNFMGGARRLTVRARLSNILAESLATTACQEVGEGDFARLNGQLAVELFQPFLFSSRNSVSASAFLERQSVRNAFIRRAVGLDLAFSRDLGQRLFLTAGLRPALTDLDAADVFFCSSFSACLPEDIDIFEGANWLSPLALTFAQDRRNSILNPSAGWAWLLDGEHARAYTGSDFEYDRVLGEVSAYRRSGSTVFAARFGGGIVGQGRFAGLEDGRLRVVHPQKRFFSGGANSVRGFAENRLGPRVLFTNVESLLGYQAPTDEAPVCTPESVLEATCDPDPLRDGDFVSQPVGGTVRMEANAEVRFPILAASIQGVAFVDVGQVWADRSEVRFDELEVTPGLGLRYLTPIGPVRVDVAYRFGGQEVLPVSTRGLRRFVSGADNEADRITVAWADGESRTLDWLKTDDVSFLSRGASIGRTGSFWSHLQLHISIGQAF
jgi:outer membrane protein insertion porin family/translocation and assembly module TamA